jgi:phosphohistidine swiveling domain-containing protein
MTRLLDLDDEASLDPAIVGGKAAWLSGARAAGLPVLPGFIVPVAEAAGTLSLGASALASGGHGAAQLEVLGVELDAALASELERAGSRLSERLIVRSSSPLELEGLWSGAFTSYRGIAPDELALTVRGCWSSAFTGDVIERLRLSGTEASALALAVLVQPELALEAGGSARAGDDDAVTVVGVQGAPDALMAGWESGARAVVGADGTVDGVEAVASLGDATLEQVASLARSAREQFGDCLIEWGLADGAVYLLQAQRAADDSAKASGAAGLVGPGALDPALQSSAALRVARSVVRFPGPLGEVLVLPWLLGLPDGAAVEAAAGVDVGAVEVRAALAEAEGLAGELASEAWGMLPAAAREAALSLYSSLRGADVSGALAQVEALRPVDAAKGARLVGLVEAVGAALVGRSLLPRREAIWRFSVDQVGEMLADTPTESGTRRSGRLARTGPGRWEPFTIAVASVQGRSHPGEAAASGIGGGRPCVVLTREDAERFQERDVVIAPFPESWMAPLLWSASGLVTTGGSAGAHLIEVSHWLRVPAVVGCRLEESGGVNADRFGGTGALVAVDGDAGVVSVVEQGA